MTETVSQIYPNPMDYIKDKIDNKTINKMEVYIYKKMDKIYTVTLVFL